MLTPAEISPRSVLRALNVRVAAGLVGGKDRTELHISRAQNILSPFFLCVSATGKPGRTWGVRCRLPWWRTDRHTTTSSPRSSKLSPWKVHPQPGTQGPRCAPSLVRDLGSALESNGRDGNGGGRTAKLTQSLQEDAKYNSRDFIDRNACSD